MRTFASLGCLVLLGAQAFGQVTQNKPIEEKPTFEAADVHVSAPVRYPYLRGPATRQGNYEIRDATMLDLISIAYGVDSEKVVGGPIWLEMDRFDALAKPPANPTPETRKLMLQALLADRFKLEIHNDTRPVAAYALTVGKAGQLKEAAAESVDKGCKFVQPPPPPPSGPPPAPVLGYNCGNITMAAFAEGMNKMVLANQYLNGGVVVDRTGLKGSWDFSFKYTPRLPPGMGESISFTDALDKQLGLKLEPVKVPLPVIVVDRVNRKPTDNVANVAEILHIAPPPTEFEVAEVKPSDPASKNVNFRLQPGGRLNISGATLKLLIQQAWNIPEEMLIGAPSWLGEDRFDIVAKVSTEGPGSPQADFDTILLMLRGLLKERFKLETHMEDRPVKAYTLVAVKPKMKKADPTSRTRWTEGPGTDGKDPRNKNAVLSRLVTVQNMTMAELAERLQYIAPGYIHTPVLDSTGLEGSWDFTLSFSPQGMEQFVANRPREGESAAQPGGTPQAADPTGVVSLFDAIEKQLGLKLEMEKRPAPVLVIDHIERKPVDN